MNRRTAVIDATYGKNIEAMCTGATNRATF